MALTRWDPFREMVSLREAMDRLFEEGFVRPTRGWLSSELGLRVPMDMYETDDSVVVSAALPGLKSEDVDISITGNTLTLKGEFRSEEESERGSVHFRERRYGKFQRSVTLPTSVDTDAAEAEFKDGVLRVTLPETEEAKPKQIPVKVKS